jgi:glc operon protein GlcG
MTTVFAAGFGRHISLKRDERGGRWSLPEYARGLRLNPNVPAMPATDIEISTMTKLAAMSVGILAMAFCVPVAAQTVSVKVLDQSGAETVLLAARESAQQRKAPSAIAGVDPAGDLLAFQRMDGVRPASADLAIEKARTAARLQRPTAEIEDNINKGRTAFITSGIAALRGGMPVRVGGDVVGAVGVAGLNKDTDTAIADSAAAALSPAATTTGQHD